MIFFKFSAGVSMPSTSIPVMDIISPSSFGETLDKSKYSWFAVGEADYIGGENEYYVVLDEIKPIDTLEKRVEELKQHLLSENFVIDSEEFDLVGGLHVH